MITKFNKVNCLEIFIYNIAIKKLTRNFLEKKYWIYILLKLIIKILQISKKNL